MLTTQLMVKHWMNTHSTVLVCMVQAVPHSVPPNPNDTLLFSVPAIEQHGHVRERQHGEGRSTLSTGVTSEVLGYSDGTERYLCTVMVQRGTCVQ